MARERGFKGLVAASGEAGLALARKFNPDAISLDLRLPQMDGLTLLDILKHDPTLLHIPVHVISVEEQRQQAVQFGAMSYLQKPVSKEKLEAVFEQLQSRAERGIGRLLIVEDNETERLSISELIGNGDVQITAVGSGKAALAALKADVFDCMVLDLRLPDISGFKVIERMQQELGLTNLPVIVYTGKELTRQEETKLRQAAESIIIKGVKSQERLLAETALFLHRVEANLPEAKRRMLRQMVQADPLLEGKKVLIVDDDIRNIFAMTSYLERYKIQIVYAENGRDAIELLQGSPEIAIILMDIMMPEMDGYETIQAIRQLDPLKGLPIIAVTAKAMKEDREKCIAAGASDYLPKPVDMEQLLSLMRVWLYK
jgi:CheY-like chemotaxis protein